MRFLKHGDLQRGTRALLHLANNVHDSPGVRAGRAKIPTPWQLMTTWAAQRLCEDDVARQGVNDVLPWTDRTWMSELDLVVGIQRGEKIRQ